MTGSGGYSRTSARRTSGVAALVAAVALQPAPVLARDVVVAVPASTLDVALMALARANAADIISTEPGLRMVRTRPVQGRMSLRHALDALLAGTGYRALAVAGGGYRIVRGDAAAPPRTKPPRRTAPPVLAQADSDIIVTGSKQRVSLLRYPGSVTMVSGGHALSATGAGDLSDLTRSVPVLESTQLGPGRNKIFIRGIADSSFNGATQSTASIYLDDVQLNYSGSDPGLRLYDIAAVDVMEGPQGTLYGAGAIGGVIRLTANAPDLTAVHSSLAGGVTATQAGAPGFDLAGMVNVPLRNDRVGLRVVGYSVRDGGYLDDPGRHLSDVNRDDTVGGRIVLRIDPGNRWRIEASGAGQAIDTRDGQYAEAAVGRLARTARIAQPFASRFYFGRLLVSKDWDSGLRLVSATGIAVIDTHEMFDASATAPPGPPSPPLRYETYNNKRLLTQELRLSRTLVNGRSWVAGLTLSTNNDVLSRSLGNVGDEASIIGVTNVTQTASLFGEATQPLTHRLALTLGARATIARIDGEPSSTPRGANFIKGRSTKRLDPTVALSWNFATRVAAFARYQTGYRTGGLAVARGVGRVADYQSDSISVAEVGLRRLRAGATGITLSGSASVAHWVGIQADLINRRGASYTANLGDARIVTVEGSAEWVPLAGLGATASFLYTQNEVTGPTADLSKRNNRRLAETPPLAAHAAVAYAWQAGRAMTLRTGATANYVGRSVLGVGDVLDISQGRDLLIGLTGGAKWRNVDVSVELDNLTNTTTNRFAFGNPFEFSTRDETTPPRPRNVRLGVAVAW